MSLIYTVIFGENTKVLCEYSEKGGNFQQKCLKMINKFQENDKSCMEYERYFKA